MFLYKPLVYALFVVYCSLTRKPISRHFSLRTKYINLSTLSEYLYYPEKPLESLTMTLLLLVTMLCSYMSVGLFMSMLCLIQSSIIMFDIYWTNEHNLNISNNKNVLLNFALLSHAVAVIGSIIFVYLKIHSFEIFSILTLMMILLVLATLTDKEGPYRNLIHYISVVEHYLIFLCTFFL